MSTPLRVLVAPKDDNPYYELLYGALGSDELVVTYMDGPTRSQTLNLLLAPASLAYYRARGYRLLHLHWLFKFTLPWARESETARRAMQRWFGAFLLTAGRLGFRIVWTAHDLVPHERIFHDDDRARATLIRRCDLIVALSTVSAGQLAACGARHVSVIPLGPYAKRHATGLGRREARAAHGLDDRSFVVAWFGKIAPYKGVDRLLEAAARLPDTSPVQIVIAGECLDERYRDELAARARPLGRRAVVRFDRLPDDEIGSVLVAADLAVFPFREVTNSSSVVTAFSFGLPVVVPDLPGLRDLPDACTLRWEPKHEDLATVLGRAAALPSEALRTMGEAAMAFANETAWPGAARSLLESYRLLVEGR